MDGRVFIDLSRFENRTGEVGLIGRIGEQLCFQAEAFVLVEPAVILFAVQKVPGVELDAGLIGADRHDATSFGVHDRRGRS